MNELGAARVIYAYANRSTQGNDSARSDNTGATTSVVYGTVAFVGDGETSYTYTAADGTSITVTPAIGEYAVVLDSGETVIISSSMPLSVGDRVSLVYQSGRWVVVSNEATVANIEKSKQEAINEAARQIQEAADKAAADTKTQVEEQLSPFREDYDNFKATHTYTDENVDKKISDSETSTKTAYEGAIKDATQGLVTTATYESGINGVTSSIDEKYTEVKESISSTNGELADAKADLASNYVKNTDENYTYVRDKKSQITQTIDQVSSVMGDSETLSDAVGAIAESKASSAVTQGATSLRSEISQTYATKTDVSETYATKTDAQAMADTAESNATKAGQSAAGTAEANAKADTAEKLKSYSTTVEMNSAIDQKADSISSTVEQNVLNTVGESYATKTSLTQTADDLQLQINAALTDVTVEYATSASATSAPTSGWSTDSPTWTSGLYVWQRTTTYVTQKADDGTRTKTVYSQKVVCIQGAKGEAGSAGKDGANGKDGTNGTSVTVSSIVYAASASGTTAPSSGWQSGVPSVDQGQWLWCRTTYSDGTAADTCSYQGTDGADGKSVAIQSATKSGKTTTVVLASTDGSTKTLTIADGTDGSNGSAGLNGYVHVAWATSADGSTGFSTSVSTGKTYIGVYTDNTKADSETPSDYSWSLIKGEKGDTGAKGADGKSPTVTATKSGTVTTITITNPDGSTSTQRVNDGTNGTSGANGYVHVKYSDDGGSTLTANDGETAGAWLGQYTDNTKADSTDPSKYTWYKILGATGAKGDTGEKGSTGDPGRGVTSIVTQYTRSSSSTSNSAYGGWSTTCPSYSSSYPYYWTRQYITYTTGATAYAPSSTGAYDGGLSDANKTAATASTTASSAQSDITNFKKQFTFGTSGLTITTTAGKTVLSTSYDSDGSASLNNVTLMKSAHAQLSVKDWGIYYGNDKGTSGSGDSNVHFWVTEGKYGGKTSGTVKYSDSPASEPEIHLDACGIYLTISASKGLEVYVNEAYLKLAQGTTYFQAAKDNMQIFMNTTGINLQAAGTSHWTTSTAW